MIIIVFIFVIWLVTIALIFWTVKNLKLNVNINYTVPEVTEISDNYNDKGEPILDNTEEDYLADILKEVHDIMQDDTLGDKKQG